MDRGDEVKIKGIIGWKRDGCVSVGTHAGNIVLPEDEVEPVKTENIEYRNPTSFVEADAAWAAGPSKSGLQEYVYLRGWRKMARVPSTTDSRLVDLRVFKDWHVETIDDTPQKRVKIGDKVQPPVYTPPEGVYGPVLGKDVPEGWERCPAQFAPDTDNAWTTNKSPSSVMLYWTRKPEPKTVIAIGKTYRLTASDLLIRPLAIHDDLVWCLVTENGAHLTYDLDKLEKYTVEVDE